VFSCGKLHSTKEQLLGLAEQLLKRNYLDNIYPIKNTPRSRNSTKFYLISVKPYLISVLRLSVNMPCSVRHSKTLGREMSNFHYGVHLKIDYYSNCIFLVRIIN
jgi:hypothetical protein